MKRDIHGLRTQFPQPTVVCQHAGDSTERGSFNGKSVGHEVEETLPWTGRVEHQPDSTRIASDHRSDLQQFQTDGRTLGMRQFRALQSESAHVLQQDVGQAAQQKPELIRPPLVAAGAVGEQIQLLLLESVRAGMRSRT